ncbi:hypothetical protein BC826DRAFT_722013 [Russula brevipes]|nr:hypothetical protein BC826DRAFT_183275 [Russula brevipes]KAI0288076.1 hypothetical protein BC826DRAFT_722013 [Russula brevipes]
MRGAVSWWLWPFVVSPQGRTCLCNITCNHDKDNSFVTVRTAWRAWAASRYKVCTFEFFLVLVAATRGPCALS